MVDIGGQFFPRVSFTTINVVSRAPPRLLPSQSWSAGGVLLVFCDLVAPTAPRTAPNAKWVPSPRDRMGARRILAKRFYQLTNLRDRRGAENGPKQPFIVPVTGAVHPLFCHERQERPGMLSGPDRGVSVHKNQNWGGTAALFAAGRTALKKRPCTAHAPRTPAVAQGARISGEYEPPGAGIELSGCKNALPVP